MLRMGVAAKRKPYLPDKACWLKIRNPNYSQCEGREVFSSESVTAMLILRCGMIVPVRLAGPDLSCTRTHQSKHHSRRAIRRTLLFVVIIITCMRHELQSVRTVQIADEWARDTRLDVDDC